MTCFFLTRAWLYEEELLASVTFLLVVPAQCVILKRSHCYLVRGKKNKHAFRFVFHSDLQDLAALVLFTL